MRQVNFDAFPTQVKTAALDAEEHDNHKHLHDGDESGPVAPRDSHFGNIDYCSSILPSAARVSALGTSSL